MARRLVGGSLWWLMVGSEDVSSPPLLTTFDMRLTFLIGPEWLLWDQGDDEDMTYHHVGF